MREVRVVWVLLALVADAVFATYARLPPDQLYHVTGSGFRGGLSRVVVELNFPDALIALAVLGVIATALPRALRLVALVAVSEWLESILGRELEGYVHRAGQWP